MSSEDPRMKIVDSVLWTWILKNLGMIEKSDDTSVNFILDEIAQQRHWQDLFDLIKKPQRQKLNQAEWTIYGKLIEDCATIFVRDAARATVYTIAQLANDWPDDSEFGWVIVDEATTMTEAQLVQTWGKRDLEAIFLVGDQAQLGPVAQTKPNENLFV